MNITSSVKINRFVAFVAAIAVSASAGAQELALKKNSDADLPCVISNRSSLQWRSSGESFERFTVKLDSLLKGTKKNVNVWHLGASHVQAGVFSFRMTENLETLNPGMMGDRGFVFPVSLANTNCDKSYSIRTEGKWTCPLMNLLSTPGSPRYGITGFAATTGDPSAKVSFDLNSPGGKRWTFKRVRVMGYASDSTLAYPSIISEQGDTLSYEYDSVTSSFLFELPAETARLTVSFTIKSGASFTLTGIQPISDRAGVNYFSSGVNGASTRTWLEKAVDLDRDLEIVKPDLCIFGLGINDSACSSDRFNPERFKDNYDQLIQMILRHSPDCAFIFMTTNDSYYYTGRGRSMTYNENGPAVRLAMYQLAKKYDSPVWDIYGIMGGRKSVNRWCNTGLVGNDHLHLTGRGYELLGDLLYNAIAEEYNGLE